MTKAKHSNTNQTDFDDGNMLVSIVQNEPKFQ